MKYSIVMPAFVRNPQHSQLVKETIEDVKSHSEDYELIVVDDGSTLPTGFLKQEADTYIRHNPINKGIAPSWNDGKNIARGEYIVIINDDIKVIDGWLDIMSEAFRVLPDCGVVGTRMAGPNVVPGALDEDYIQDHKWFSGYCFMLRRGVFTEDFDEQFVPFNFEDIDYWERIQESGWSMIKAPLAIWHKEGDTIHEMNYSGTDNKNLQKFVYKWGFNPKSKYFA